MPTYQYACTACDHRFEAVQSFSDDALTECPQCQGPLRKLFSSVGIVFKGSGFYRTDSRNAGAKAGAKAGGDTKTPESGGTESSGSKAAESPASGSSSDTSSSGSASKPPASSSSTSTSAA